MHRILSYQTAMRAGDDRSIGQYITKRICISFVFSIGFFTLICGFLLGKYATDRDYKLKEIHNSDLISNFNEIQIIRKSLIETSSHINVTDKNHLNGIIFKEFIQCTDNKDIDNFSDPFDAFIAKFVPNHLHILVKCYKDLNEFIKKI